MHGGSNTAEWILAVVAGVALVVAAAALRANWRSNRLPWVFNFLTEYERREPQRRYVVTLLADDHDPKEGVPRGDPGHSEVVSVTHYLNQLGFLVESGTVRLEDVAAIMGPSVVHMWTTLKPYIEGERASRRDQKHRDPAYAEFFERLATRVDAMTPQAARRRLLDPTPCERFNDKLFGRR